MKSLKEFMHMKDVIMDGGSLDYFEDFAEKFSNAFHTGVRGALDEIDQKLKSFGYTLGELDYSEEFEDEGSEDFLIFDFSTKDTVRNVYITLTWEKVQGQQYYQRDDGGKLRYDVRIMINEVDPEDMDEILSEIGEIIEEEEETAYDKFFKKTLKKFGVDSPEDLSKDKKKEFFDYVDKNWEADNEVEESYAVKYAKTKNDKISVAKYDNKSEAEQFLKQIKKDGYNGMIVKEEMTDDQENRKEEIVKELKKKEKEFKERYGDRWKEVIHATATKMAMKEESLEESSRQNTIKYKHPGDKKTYNVIVFKSEKEANNFLEDNDEYGVLDERNGKIYVASLKDMGE